MIFKESVLVDRGNYKGKVDIFVEDKTISIKKEGKVLFQDLCKYLIEETNILDIQYTRINPYKLIKKKINQDSEYYYAKYIINYLEYEEYDLVEKEKEILSTHGHNMTVPGKIECFIPDLFLVMKERGYIKSLNSQKYTPTGSTQNYQVTFKELNGIKEPNKLILEGYEVPQFYYRWYEDLTGLN